MSLENIPTMTPEQTSNQGHVVLYKGPAGSGKTHNINSWPQPIVTAYFDTNKRTLKKAMDAGVDIKPYFCKDWKQFHEEFVPAVVNREVNAKTIAVDTLDVLGVMLQRDIQGTRPKFTQPDFGILLNRWMDVIGSLAHSTESYSDTPGYNFVAAVHLKDVTDSEGTLIKIAPQIMGTFRDTLEQYFDWVLLCESKLKRSGSGPAEKEFLVHTVPPSPKHTCKGGGLPAQCSGIYSELMKHDKAS